MWHYRKSFIDFSGPSLLLHLTHNDAVNPTAETSSKSLNEGNISIHKIKPSNWALIRGGIERDGSLSCAFSHTSFLFTLFPSSHSYIFH